MKQWMSITALAVVLTGAMTAAPILSLDPADGAISGTPGSTVGWGFTLSNDSGFIIPSLVVFCEGAFNTGCTPTFGTFTDFAAQAQLNVVGPTVTQTFDNGAQLGIGSFQINSNAPIGVTDLGTIYLVYDTFSCDFINTNCDAMQTGFSELLSAPASVSIVAPTSTSVPEPESASLAIAGLVLLGAVAAARRARRALA